MLFSNQRIPKLSGRITGPTSLPQLTSLIFLGKAFLPLGNHTKWQKSFFMNFLNFKQNPDWQTNFLSWAQKRDPLKEMDWKNIGESTTNDSDSGRVVKKRLPKKMRLIPDYYFLPRKSLPSAIAFYGTWIAAGVGAGVLIETWINKKVKEDGGVLWEFDK